MSSSTSGWTMICHHFIPIPALSSPKGRPIQPIGLTPCQAVPRQRFDETWGS